MQKRKFKFNSQFKSVILSFFVILSACSPPNNFSVKAISSQDITTPKVDSADFNVQVKPTSNPPDDPAKMKVTYGTDNQPEQRSKINFDNKDIPLYPKKNLVPGSISVIYKNSYNLKVNKADKKVDSTDGDAYSKVNEILTKYKVKNIHDFVSPNADPEKLKKLESDQTAEYMSNFGSEYPKYSSMHGYEFPEDANTNQIAKELRALPFVRTAYPTPIGIPDSTPAPVLVGFQGLNDIHASLPTGTTDPGFTFPENQKWWQFNRHKVFQAWDYYVRTFNSNIPTDIMNIPASNKPIITVIDDGFYQGADGDTPTFIQKANIGSNGYINNDISPTVPQNISHGTIMASLIASPKNNSYGLAGIIPGARIYGIKAAMFYSSLQGRYVFDTSALAQAIGYAASSTTDVINLSISTPGTSVNDAVPLIYNTVLSAKIDEAVRNNIPVVITAGNNGTNLDNYSFNDVGQIVVGASNYNGGRLYETGTGGVSSGYGKIVDLAAAGEAVWAMNYNILNGTAAIGPADGTSSSTAIVSAAIGMVKKMAYAARGLNLTPRELRDLIAYTGTLGVSHLPTSSKDSSCLPPTLTAVDPSGRTKELMGRGLATHQDPPYDSNYHNINLYAEIRDLNILNALTVVNYAGLGYPTIARIFNADDVTWATTNEDWNGRYAEVGYFPDTFWGFTSVPNGTHLNFSNYLGSYNGSLGYQIYRNGKFNAERLYGVVSRFDTSLSNQTLLSLNGTPYGTVGPNYDAIGCNNIYNNRGWFAGWTYIHP